MNKPLFMRIVYRLSSEVDFFRQKPDGLGRLGLSALQKCTAAIRLLAYGSAADTVDEYLWLGETTTRSCLENFVEGIIDLFCDEYLRRPTPADLQRLLYVGEHRGFPGMIGSIDCMHSIFLSNMPSNIANMMDVRTRIRDTPMHHQLKADLVEHIWSKFGHDDDNN
uniref:Nuclease HARBI1 n=1 Tax=Brassica oleracea var. oleracea TaxID=109376 RepID=A0A0D3BLH3_BRAOL